MNFYVNYKLIEYSKLQMNETFMNEEMGIPVFEQ